MTKWYGCSLTINCLNPHIFHIQIIKSMNSVRVHIHAISPFYNLEKKVHSSKPKIYEDNKNYDNGTCALDQFFVSLHVIFHPLTGNKKGMWIADGNSWFPNSTAGNLGNLLTTTAYTVSSHHNSRATVSDCRASHHRGRFHGINNYVYREGAHTLHPLLFSPPFYFSHFYLSSLAILWAPLERL